MKNKNKLVFNCVKLNKDLVMVQNTWSFQIARDIMSLKLTQKKSLIILAG